MFFVIITPFIVIYSLGYDFDWSNGRLTRNLFLNVQTIPRSAKVELGSGREYTTPAALRISSSTPQQVVITKNGYHPEKFRVWTNLTENTTAYLQSLILLPTTADLVEDLPAEREFLSFLPGNRLLATQNNLLYLYTYSPNSLSVPVPVTTQEDKTQLTSSRWEKVGQNTYFDPTTTLVLYLDPELSTWRLQNLTSVVPGAKQVVSVARNRFLILDERGNLYLWSVSRDTVQFIDSGYQGVARMDDTDSVWLRRGRDVLRLNQLQATYASLIQAPEQFRFTTLITEPSVEVSPFAVARVYRGVSVLVGEELYFSGDINPQTAGLVATEVEAVGYSEEALFYLSTEGEVQMYNLVYNNQKTLAYIDDTLVTQTRLYFDPVLKRLLVYTPSEVQAIWVDPKNFSNHLLTHSQVTWVRDEICQPATVARAQICVRENKLVKYQNLQRF